MRTALFWTILVFALALISGVYGFTGVGDPAANGIAKLLFLFFAVLLVVIVITTARRRRRLSDNRNEGNPL